MPRTAIDRHDVKYATTKLRSYLLETGDPWGGDTYNFDRTDIFSDAAEKRVTVNSANWVRSSRWSGAQEQALRPNPFTYEYTWYTPFWGKRIEIVNTQGFRAEWEGRFDYGANFDDGEFSAEEKLAILEAAKLKLGDAFKNQRVNLAQAYGERSQAKRLFVDTATRVVNGLKAVKRGDLQGAARALGITAEAQRKNARGRKAKGQQQLDLSSRVSQDWLALQYGWKPLLQDVYGVAEAIAQAHVDGVLDVVRHVGSKTRKLASAKKRAVGFVDGREYSTTTYTAKYVVRAAVPRPELLSVSSLGFTNPAAVAWELMPWSFVIDWFIRIGDYLDYLDSYSGYVFLDGSLTLFEKTISGLIVNGTAASPYGLDTVEGSGRRTKVRCYRTVLSEFPTLAPPRFKNPLSVGHVLNSLALFRTTFFKKR